MLFLRLQRGSGTLCCSFRRCIDTKTAIFDHRLPWLPDFWFSCPEKCLPCVPHKYVYSICPLCGTFFTPKSPRFRGLPEVRPPGIRPSLHRPDQGCSCTPCYKTPEVRPLGRRPVGPSSSTRKRIFAEDLRAGTLKFDPLPRPAFPADPRRHDHGRYGAGAAAAAYPLQFDPMSPSLKNRPDWRCSAHAIVDTGSRMTGRIGGTL